jgi:hypothetical protein
MKPNLEMRDPADLRLHRLQKHLPEPDKQSPEWISFVEGLISAGPENLPPLVITHEGEIMDGGRRWRAAKQLQWEQIPCLERPESEAAALIVDSLLGQRNMQRGTKVYLVLSLLPDFVRATEMRRVLNLRDRGKTGQNPLFLPKQCDTDSETVKTLCDRLGVHPDVYTRARKLHSLFEKHPEFREDLEPGLLSGEKSLWNCISHIGGALCDQSRRESSKEKSQLELFGDAFEHIRACSKVWSKFSPANQQHVLASWKTTVAVLPGDLRRELAAILSATPEEHSGRFP